MKTLKYICEKISTRPNRNTYVWNGYKSILATVLLYVLWLCRLLSLLQIVKFLKRQMYGFSQKLGWKWGKGSKDAGSKRSNISPAFQECYFIIWFVLILIFYLGVEEPFLKHILEIYYIFESAVWILYYTIFRRFFEERYSIYHPLEHLLIIILIIPTQALALADIYGTSFADAMLAIIGIGDSLPVGISVLGTIYFAVTISMIISNFPTETQKAGRHHVILGNGQVVSDKLLPALLKSNVRENQISIYSIGENQPMEGIPINDIMVDTDAVLSEEITEEATVWIETPSYTHMYYLKLLLPFHPRLIVMEKPITVVKDEIDILERIVSGEYRRNIFFLSYYMLEKALPLTYLSRRMAFYEKYLEFTDKNGAVEMYQGLGKIQKVKVVIKEGIDNRIWVNNKQYGGQLLETFVHNMLIAAEFLGEPQDWSESSLEYNVSEEKTPQNIRLTAKAKDADVELILVKNDSTYNTKKERKAEFEYANGVVVADFDEQSVVITDINSKQEHRIAVKEKYKEKYMVQIDMVGRCFSNHLDPSYIDGLDKQIEVIKWLLSKV